MQPHPLQKNAARAMLIPDCCNIGVIFRTLFASNFILLITIFLRSKDFHSGLQDFIASSMLLEWVCLLSLLTLCSLRRLLQAKHLIHAMPAWMQRALCALVPAIMTGMTIHLLSSFDWFFNNLTQLSGMQGMVLAGFYGLALQHYFELRTRAFSPALTTARLQSLQARIRPHFLFNSLNAVLSLIRTEPIKAETTLEDLADLFRVLMRDAQDMSSLQEEIHLCKQYLSIEKIRLGERLQVQWDTADIAENVLQQTQISPLMLQPLLENAVHYGIEPASTCDNAVIQIRLRHSADYIDIVVSNPYHGKLVAQEHNHMALANIRERLALLYDIEAQLTAKVIQKPFPVFEVTLRFPHMHHMHHMHHMQLPSKIKS